MNYQENLISLNKKAISIIIILIIVLLISFISQDILELNYIRNEYNTITEFLDNQSIFHNYLDKKRDLYSRLNKVAWESSGEYKEHGEYRKYDLSYALFSGLRGTWGWDEKRLDNKFSFKEIVIDVFIEDFLH